MRWLREIFISITFVGILLIPIFNSVFHFIPAKEINENRTLKSKPELKSMLLDSFPQAFDEYYNDNFNLRSQFLYFNSWFKFQVLNIEPVNKKAIVGKNGWLYLIKNTTEAYFGKNHVDDDKLKRYYEIFKYRRDFLDSLGCKYYVAIAPVKANIYPEFLPISYRIPSQVSLSDQIGIMLDTITGISFIDLKSALLNEKREIRMFNKTDTHWNDYGSYIAYEAIMNEISIRFPSLVPNDISKFHIDTIIIDGMNLTNMLGIYHEISENKIIVEPTFNKVSKEGQKRDYPAPEWFALKAEYEQIYTTENDSFPKLLMIRDSFARTVIPFMSEHFSESVYIFDGWHHDFNEDIVVYEKPDIYIQLILESQIPYLFNNSKKP